MGVEKGQVKYAQIEDYDKYDDKSHQRYQTFNEPNKIITYDKPSTKYTTMKTPVKKQENKEQEGIRQRQYTLTEKHPTKKSTEAGKAFFTNKYQRIKKEDKISTTSKTDNKTDKEQQTQKIQQRRDKDYSYSNLGHALSSTKINTNDTNVSYKGKRFEKGFDTSKTALFGKKDTTQIELKKRDLTSEKNYCGIKEKEKEKEKKLEEKKAKGLSETKTLDFSKYYKSYKKEEKKQPNIQYQKPVDKIDGKDIYEYVPVSQTKKYPRQTKQSDINKNQEEISIDLGNYTGISNKMNAKYQTTEISEETKSSEDKKRNRSSAPYNRFSFSPSSMAYFKLQFLTTKQVVEKFWNSIDNGELSISMFDPQRNSSKLSNYLSPDKNRYSKISASIENTDNTSKYRNSENINKKINYSNSESNFGNTRRKIKA